MYHLSYGGIEKAVSSLANMLHNDVNLSIVSFYKLYENPVFPIPLDVSITYLYDTNVPLKVKKYNQLLRQKKFGKLLSAVFQDYLKGFHFLSFFHDFFVSFHIYFLKGRFRKLKKFLKKSEYDVIISTQWEINSTLEMAKKSFQIMWEHNHYHGNENYKKSLLQSCKHMNRLVVVSRALSQDYQKESFSPQCKCIYIPNCLDYSLSFSSNYSSRRILMVGRLEQEKGLFDALLVMKRLQERMISFHLDIVGDGPLRKDLEKHIQDKNLSNFVKIHGFQSHDYIEALYRDCSLYLMTSFTESFGMVLIEAMNASIPCLAFDSAEGACELLANDVNGYLIANRNLDEMANKIIYLLDHVEELSRLGRNAKEFSKNFLPNSIQKMWLDLVDGD